MAQKNDFNTEEQDQYEKQSWKNVIGFSLSIILAAFALWTAFYSGGSIKVIPAVISGFAFLQAVLQLCYASTHYKT